MTTTTREVVQATMMCSFLLIVKFIVCLIFQGGAKGKAGLRAPEDAGLVSKKAGWTDAQSFGGHGSAEAIESARRWDRIIMNDLENIPFALIMAWGSVISGVGGDPESRAQAFIAFLIFYTVSRILHTIAFIFGMQPWRTVFWTTALVSMFIFSVIGLVAGFED